MSYKDQYNKELQRINREIKRLGKVGVTVSPNVIPTAPKRIRAGSVRRLQKITRGYIEEHSDYEEVKGEAPLSLQYKRALNALKRASKSYIFETEKSKTVANLVPSKKSIARIKKITANIRKHNYAQDKVNITVDEKLRDEYRKARRRVQGRVSRLKNLGYEFDEYNYPVPARVKRYTQDAIDELNKLTTHELLKYTTHKWEGYDIPGGLYHDVMLKEARSAAAAKRMKNRALYNDYISGNLDNVQPDQEIDEYEFDPDRVTSDEYEPYQESVPSELDIDFEPYGEPTEEWTPSGPPDRYDKVLRYMLDALNVWTPLSTWSNPIYRQMRIDYVEEIARIIDDALESDGFSTVAIRCEEHAESITYAFDRVLYDSGDKNDPNWLDTNLSYIIAVIQGGNLTLAENAFLTEYGEEQSV